MKTKIKITAHNPKDQPVVDQLASCSNAIREGKLKIAKLVYKEVTAAIRKWEEYEGNEVRCNWDEYITVDGEGFSYFDMVEGDDASP
jgi:hypothetical protein